MSNQKRVEDMRHWKQLFDNNWVGSWDIPEDGLTVTIESITFRPVFNQKMQAEKPEPVILFKGAKKPWIVNKTNTGTIAELYGAKPAEWIGKRITLIVREVIAFGKVVPGIRVLNKRPADPKPGQSDPDPAPAEGSQLSDLLENEQSE